MSDREQRIRVRAYAIWEGEGRHDGRAEEHWPAWCRDRLAGAEELSGVGERPLSCPWMPIVPFKLNQDRRHHIPRQRRTVTNWPAYDASLRQRGSLTVWFTDEAITAWAAEPRPLGVASLGTRNSLNRTGFSGG